MPQNTYEKRLEDRIDELTSLYHSLYRNIPYVDQQFKTLLTVMRKAFDDRSKALIVTDQENTQWYHSNKLVGMMLYVDLFNGDLKGVLEKIPYLKELGITYVHFMPILQAREGENDGGFAVADYREIDPRFGSMEEFRLLVEALHKEGIAVCLDYVVNHTAKEHTWAKRALEGEQEYQDLYFMFDSEEIPMAYEATVPEVFPKVSPGNFTYYPEIKKWVFTSFYEYQWDLNYQNPTVFSHMVDTLLYLANTGAQIIRLDAIPFMWKELGTNCRNLPQVHTLVRLFRLITEIVCPSVILLGEAIVEPYQIVKYFGQEGSEECQILYNAAHMVNIWNSLATRDARLMTRSVKYGFGIPHAACWINYARCHDDIGWGMNEDLIRGLGQDPAIHKQFLINFYQGEHPASFAKGELYEFDPEIPDARNSGSLASLAGLETSLANKDEYQRELAQKRILLIHSQLLAEPGIPLLYSGDEVATLNDYTYLEDPQKAHDSRWLHRPAFDWVRAENRNDFSTDEGRVFQTLKRLISIRKEQEFFRSDLPTRMIECFESAVYSFVKYLQKESFVFLGNYSEERKWVHSEAFQQVGIYGKKTDLITGKTVDFSKEQILLGPYEYLWLV